MFFFCKQKTAYEMRISDWSSDVCSSDLRHDRRRGAGPASAAAAWLGFRKSPDLGSLGAGGPHRRRRDRHAAGIHHRLSARLVIHRHARWTADLARRRLVSSEEHTSELQSLMRSSESVFRLQKHTRVTIYDHNL